MPVLRSTCSCDSSPTASRRQQRFSLSFFLLRLNNRCHHLSLSFFAAHLVHRLPGHHHHTTLHHHAISSCSPCSAACTYPSSALFSHACTHTHKQPLQSFPSVFNQTHNKTNHKPQTPSQSHEARLHRRCCALRGRPCQGWHQPFGKDQYIFHFTCSILSWCQAILKLVWLTSYSVSDIFPPLPPSHPTFPSCIT